MDFKPYFDAYPTLEELYFVGGEVFLGQNADNDAQNHAAYLRSVGQSGEIVTVKRSEQSAGKPKKT